MNLPEGWPTDEMVDKAVIVLRDRAYIPLEDGRQLTNLMIRAAIAAAPTPPAQEDEPVLFVNSVSLKSEGSPETQVYQDVYFDTPLYTRPADDKPKGNLVGAGDGCETRVAEYRTAADDKLRLTSRVPYREAFQRGAASCDKLRKAAEGVYEKWKAGIIGSTEAMIELRAALEGK